MTECLFRAGFLVRRAGLLDSCAKLLNVSVDGIDKAGCGVGVDEGFCGCLCVDARDGSGCDIGGTADEEGDGEEEEEDAVFFLLEMDLKLASTCCFRDRLLAGADEEAAAACFAAGSALLCLEGWCNDMLHSFECGSLVDARSRGAEEPRRACLIQCGRAGRLCFTRERAPGVAAGVLVFSRRAGSARAGEKEGAGRRGERERGRAVGETRTDMLTCLGVLWTGRTAARAGVRGPPPGRQSQQEASRETTDRTSGPQSEAKHSTAQHSTRHQQNEDILHWRGEARRQGRRQRRRQQDHVSLRGEGPLVVLLLPEKLCGPVHDLLCPDHCRAHAARPETVDRGGRVCWPHLRASRGRRRRPHHRQGLPDPARLHAPQQALRGLSCPALACGDRPHRRRCPGEPGRPTAGRRRARRPAFPLPEPARGGRAHEGAAGARRDQDCAPAVDRERASAGREARRACGQVRGPHVVVQDVLQAGQENQLMLRADVSAVSSL